MKFLSFSLLLAYFLPCYSQSIAPRWLYELPLIEGKSFAIGESGNYAESSQESIEARHVAAFRLAASMSVSVRFGLADKLGTAGVRHVSFVSISIDTLLMELIESEMTIIDSVYTEEGFHLLATYGNGGNLPRKYLNKVKSSRTRPSWILNPPKKAGMIYGVGSSRKRGLNGLEDAERMARGELAIQTAIIANTEVWSISRTNYSESQTVTNHTSEVVLLESKVVARAVDSNGVSYVMVCMPYD